MVKKYVKNRVVNNQNMIKVNKNKSIIKLKFLKLSKTQSESYIDHLNNTLQPGLRV